MQDERGPAWAGGQLPGSKVIGDRFHGVFPYAPMPQPEPRWIRFHAQPGEPLADIARRFGVTTEEIEGWNGLRSGRDTLRRAKWLRIRAQRFPPYRKRILYWVRDGDTWESIARALRVTVEDLKRFNRDQAGRNLRDGDRLRIWVESALPRWRSRESRCAQRTVRVNVPAGAVSLGRPSRGRLLHSERLPESDLYTLKYPHWSYASTNTMAQLHRGIAAFRRRTGFEGEVLITSVSRRRGGRFDPHRSHQSGRDVDVGFLPYAGFGDGEKTHGHLVDWGATWALVREFIQTGEVDRVYLSYSAQKSLYRAARSMGEPSAALRRLLQYPRGPRAHAVIRHEPGHDRHFHVRWSCGPADRRCRGNLRSDVWAGR